MGYRKCKVCGCNYEYCKPPQGIRNMFRWQDVACCQEHGDAYFKAIIESREEAEEVVEIDVDILDINDFSDYEEDDISEHEEDEYSESF